MQSILQTVKECFVCHSTQNLELHHVYYGTANRTQSDRTGCVCWLCHEHHTGNTGVHFNKELNDELKQYTQQKFEETHTRDEFRAIFGKSYLP